jgi:DnaJ-class molecular chaperone
MNPNDFNIEKIEQMEVNFETCPKCKGGGIIWNEYTRFNCPVCNGNGDLPLSERRENASL